MAKVPHHHRNFAPQYMKLILKVIGITHVVIAHGEGAEVVDIGAATMEAFVEIDTAG